MVLRRRSVTSDVSDYGTSPLAKPTTETPLPEVLKQYTSQLLTATGDGHAILPTQPNFPEPIVPKFVLSPHATGTEIANQTFQTVDSTIPLESCMYMNCAEIRSPTRN